LSAMEKNKLGQTVFEWVESAHEDYERRYKARSRQADFAVKLLKDRHSWDVTMPLSITASPSDTPGDIKFEFSGGFPPYRAEIVEGRGELKYGTYSPAQGETQVSVRIYDFLGRRRTLSFIVTKN